MRERELKKKFDLDGIETEWEDETFPEDKLLRTLHNDHQKKENRV